MYNNDPKYMNPPEAGLASLLASRGRNGDSVLVHMAPEEVQGLQKLALAHGGSLTINPETGLYEASFLKKLLPTIAGAILNTVAPGIGGAVGKFFGLSGAAASTLGTGLLVGGATALIEGDLKKGLMAGLGAYGGANLAQSLQAAAAAPAAPSAEEVVKAAEATDAAKSIVGAGEGAVMNPSVPADLMGPPDVASGMGGSFTRPSLGGAQFDKAGNLIMSEALSKPTSVSGLPGILEGGKSLLTNPNARGAFMQGLGGGFESPMAQNLSRYATFAGVADAFTPEYQMPSGEEEGASVYIPGAINPMYSYGRQYGYFLPGQYYRKTKQGLVPYNPYAMAPGVVGAAGGGLMYANDKLPRELMPYPQPNQNYPLSTVTNANFSPAAPRPREVVGGYGPRIDPFTGEEKFADGGQVGVAPPKGPPLVQPPPVEPPVGPPPVVLPPDNPFDPARQRYMDMINAPPKPPVDTKAVMDYVADLNRRAKTPEFIAFPPGGIVTPPSTGGGDTGGDKGDKGDKDEPTGPGGGRGTGGGGIGGGGGGGGGIGGGGGGTGGTGSKPGGGTGNKPGSGGPPGTGEDEGDADPNQDDPDADKKDEDGLLDKAKDRFMEWFNKRFRDPYGLVGTAIGFTGAGALGTWAWDKLTPQIQKFFTSTQELTPEQQAEVERIIEEKAKQEKEAKEKREGIVSRGEGRGGTGGGIGGGFGGGGFGGGGGRRGKITIEEMPQPARAGGHVRAMQAGGMAMPPPNNPYGAAVGEDYNFGFSGGGAMPTEYLAGGKLLEGEGDGMSDSIPAVIRGKGVQRAALADGEFVVPADVVSHLGNGSTKAGAKKLYAMMDRIREARTGRTRQSPAVKADKYLPA